MTQPFVHEAELRLDPGTDPRLPGAVVTVALCGHWEHEGACRWPHNNEIWPADVSLFRTVFVASEAEADEVHARIDRALRSAGGWRVVRSGTRPPTSDERTLADGPA